MVQCCRVKSCFILKAPVHRAHEPALPRVAFASPDPLPCPAFVPSWLRAPNFLSLPLQLGLKRIRRTTDAVALAHFFFSYIFQDSSFISLVEVGEPKPWVLEDCW